MKFLGSKTIETERLILHKTEETDLKKLWSILLLEEVSKYYLTAKINTDWEKEKIWQMKKLQKASNLDTFIWTIELKDSKDVIGQISLHPTDKDNIMDIGWFLDPSFHKKGYAYEAALNVLKYMFLECDLEKIETCVCKKNPNSYHLMEKLGFERQDTTRMIKYTLLDTEEECFNYDLTKEDFIKKKEG
ncbi:MAG: GNAT family N-acetyltransferase [Bacilli bacterium]|nr:GNAT family N-acetyltransferase [Bacilli bacterium]